MKNEKFVVWVGGVEVHDYLIDTLEEAEKLAEFWGSIQEHDDVKIEKVQA